LEKGTEPRKLYSIKEEIAKRGGITIDKKRKQDVFPKHVSLRALKTKPFYTS